MPASLPISTAAFNNAGLMDIGTNTITVGHGTRYSNTGTISLDTGGQLSIACFAAGTRIATERGAVAVEQLRPGDARPTHFAGRARIRWIGHRRTACRRHPRPWEVQPVRISPDAFGPGQPAAALRLSPDHAVFHDGVLKPVRYLVNGATIVQEDVAEVTYWHIELARHDVLRAESLDCETDLDTGNRGAFANGGTAIDIHPEFALETWRRDGCAPLVRDGAALLAARSRLHRRAMMLGFRLSRDPDLHLLADGRRIVPTRLANGVHRFVLPLRPHCLRLRSHAGVPAETGLASPDRRRLGVMLGRIVIAQNGGRRAFELADAPGLHAIEGDGSARDWRWTDGDAMLRSRRWRPARPSLIARFSPRSRTGGFRLTIGRGRRGSAADCVTEGFRQTWQGSAAADRAVVPRPPKKPTRRSSVPIYMYEFAYNSDSWAAQLKKPQNRIETVGNALCDAVGGKLLGGWYCFGEYDAVLVMDLPDNESMTAVALAVAAGGAASSAKTTVLMTGEQAVAAMKKAGAVAKGYKPAR